MYGWQDAPHFTAVERFADYELPIGYIKGGTTRAATRRQFIVEAIDGTAGMQLLFIALQVYNSFFKLSDVAVLCEGNFG